MPHYVEYFIWGYQEHFHLGAEVQARILFEKLDPDFDVRVHLVGILTQEREDRHSVCVVPVDSTYQPEVFAGVPERAHVLGRYDPAVHGIYTHSQMQAEAEHHIKLNGMKRAVEESLGETPDRSEWMFFTSTPIDIEDYQVLVVLELTRKVFNRHYHLTKNKACGCWSEPSTFPRSLIEATASEFLGACRKELSTPDPGHCYFLTLNVDEILRTAGKNMFGAPILAGNRHNYFAPQFDACSTISTLRYEGAHCAGRIVYVSRNHPSLELDIALKAPVHLEQYEAVRKLLELSSENLALLCDAATIYGLGRISHTYDELREDVFEVRFERQFIWQLLHAGHPLMHVQYGKPQLIIPDFPVKRFNRDLPRIFGGIDTTDIDHLLALARSVASQHHGAMLVISDQAEKEAERLSNQCTRVEPFELTDDAIAHVTSIDGAVLVNPKGVCHAIGVILDGLSDPRCTPARGARFNSAVRFVYQKKGRVAVVKSEDGRVSFLPELMPMIHRSEIEEAMQRLRILSESPEVSDREFFETIGWFNEHKFYLSQRTCDEINHLCREIEGRLTIQKLANEYTPFVPSPHMDESYFFQE
ncbi:MAG: DNA integrity scanning protein DisA nucleotide-binding domain protein [Pirellulales bacterium]|nr:DNA integrity scanning protein DisA nucleotide-binding domain protein [Pirellulales bacterium]